MAGQCPAFFMTLELLFNGLTTTDAVILVVASFLGSAMTAAFGVGGGAFLITVMAGIVPPLALIPAHGVVQLGSNASRAWLSREHTSWPQVRYFAWGAVPAAVLAGVVIGQMRSEWIPLLVAGFILWLSWGPLPSVIHKRTPAVMITGGALTTVATMVFGATGPLVSAWMGRGDVSKWQYTADFSFCMTLQHFLKLVIFIALGFAFIEWLPLLGLMLVAGYLGTKAGLKMLGRLPDALFRKAFRWILTLLAIRLIAPFVLPLIDG